MVNYTQAGGGFNITHNVPSIGVVKQKIGGVCEPNT